MKTIIAIILGGAIIIAYQLANAAEKNIVLTSQNTIILNGPIDTTSVADVIKQARKLDAKPLLPFLSAFNAQPLYLFLYTPGGEIQMGLEMLEALNGLHRQVNTITLFAASMGFQTVQNLGERYILSSGVLMSHHAKGGFEGEFGGQGISQVRARLNFWIRRLDFMDLVTVSRTNGRQTMESYQAAYDHELWLSAYQAIEGGYADQVVTISCDDSLSGVVQHNVPGPFGTTIAYDLDACPINTTPSNIRLKIPTTEGDKDSDEFANKGGGFGASCLIAKGLDNKKLCATNTSITADLLTDLRTKVKDRFVNIRNYIQ